MIRYWFYRFLNEIVILQLFPAAWVLSRLFDLSFWFGFEENSEWSWRSGTYKIQSNIQTWYVGNFNLSIGWPPKAKRP